MIFPDAFHRHLDGCKQCRENPFNLCREGEMLLRASAIEIEQQKLKDKSR